MRAMNLATLARHLERAAQKKPAASAGRASQRAEPGARPSAAELILILASDGDDRTRVVDEPKG